MKKITICGYFGYHNAGDELILKSIILNCQREIKDVEITVLSSDPQETIETFKVKAVNRWNPFSIIHSFITADLVIFGGGLFQDVTGFLTIYYYVKLIAIAKILGKKVLLYGVDFAPINRKTSKWVLGFILKHVDRIMVRSQGSMNFVNNLNPGKKNYELSADAVLLSNVNSAAWKNMAELKKIGIILRRINNDKYTATIKDICEAIVNRLGAKLVFIPFHLEEDLNFSLEIIRELSTPAIISRWCYAEDLFDILGDVDFIISQRFHGLIIGSLLKVPMMGVSNDPKLEYFCSEIGQKHISLNDLNPDKITGMIEDTWKSQKDFKSLLDKSLLELKNRSYLNITRTLELLSLPYEGIAVRLP